MIELSTIRANANFVKERLAVKNFADLSIVDDILAVDEKRRKTQVKLDELKATENAFAKEIGQLIKEGKQDEAAQKKADVAKIKIESESLKELLPTLENEQLELLVKLPNLPYAQVPKGKTAEDNEVVASWGNTPTLPANAMPHWDIAKKYNVFDLELGVKITGAGFPLFRGKGARLQRALINFFLDEAMAAGYQEIVPPFMVNEASAFGTGQLPDKEGQMYHVTLDKFYLIPTSEVPVTNIVRDEIIEEKALPLMFTAYSPCFRREAGSYGKDVRGLNRVHQFDKVEIVQITHPDKSYETLDKMVAHVGGLLQKLGLQYRILRLCGGDMSFASAITYDFEVYSAAQQRWLEVSSVSNFETYQTNRMKVRFRDSNKKTRLAHSLNGSALALPRIIASILENYQTENGVTVPDVLRKYTGFELID